MTEKVQRAYGTGKRKAAVARVWLSSGTGNISVNGMPMGEYLPRLSLQERVREPLERVEMVGRMDVMAKTRGGGLRGQADAIRHGIARALLDYDEGLRPTLRQAGFLTRDARVKERKKYGRKRARRGFQFSKR